jgi:hypothetical protein
MFEVGYTFGWRVPEVKNLSIRQIDIGSSRILLDPGTTKNDDGRVVKFKPGSVLASLLTACCHGKQSDDYVFTREDGESGPRFPLAWAKVCCACELGQMTSAECRKVVDSSVAEGVIMKMGGWKTRSVFERYAIVAESDMDDAIERVEALRAQIGHKEPEIAPKQMQIWQQELP